MDGKRVLVTGGAGFIGSNLANHLAGDNDAIATDDLYLGMPENLDDAMEFHGTTVLDDDLPTEGVDVVFHLATLLPYKMHGENPTKGARVNIEDFVSTVEQARKDDRDTVVYAATSSIYGLRTESLPGDMPIESQTGYEVSKLGRERYAEYFYHHYDMQLAGVRSFSVYQGFGGTEEYKGEFANTVTQFTDKIADGESPELFGDDTQARGFTHIDDIVRGLELAASERLQGIYNLGTGESYSFNEMVEMINEVLGTDAGPVYVGNPFEMYIHNTKADYSKIHDTIGWEPQVSFEAGVERVCQPYLDG